MARRLIKIIIATVILAIPVSIVVRNRDMVSLHLFGEAPYTLSVGVLVLAAFISGVLLSTLIASIFGLFSWWERKKLLKREALRNAFYKTLIEARSATASKELSGARNMWQTLVAKDPTNIIAMIELSKVYRELGDSKEALKVLEAVRVQNPNNSEVLFLISDLFEESGNFTAALDNLSILLLNKFNPHAARRSAELLEKLSRWDDALEVIERLEYHGVDIPAIGDRIKFKVISTRTYLRPEDEQTALLEFIKKHPSHTPAYRQLSKLYLTLGSNIEAAQTLLKCARATESFELLQEATELLIENGHDFKKALGTARTALTTTSPAIQPSAKLLLAYLHIRAEQVNEAEEILNQIRDNLINVSNSISQKDQLIYTALQAMILLMKGRESELHMVLKELITKAMRPDLIDQTYKQITRSESNIGQEAAPSLYFT